MARRRLRRSAMGGLVRRPFLPTRFPSHAMLVAALCVLAVVLWWLFLRITSHEVCLESLSGVYRTISESEYLQQQLRDCGAVPGDL